MIHLSHMGFEMRFVGKYRDVCVGKCRGILLLVVRETYLVLLVRLISIDYLVCIENNSTYVSS